MAIASSDLKLYRSFTEVTPGAANNVFPDAPVDAATDYVLLEVRNTHATLTLSSVVAWLMVDPAGATLSLAVADGTARAEGYGYPVISAAGLTYSTPTSAGAGMALPNLGPHQKCLIALRRTFAGATTAFPEVNSVAVNGLSPI